MANDMFDEGSLLRRRKIYRRLSSHDYHQHPPYSVFYGKNIQIPSQNDKDIAHSKNIKTETEDEIAISKNISKMHGISSSSYDCSTEQEPKEYMVSYCGHSKPNMFSRMQWSE